MHVFRGVNELVSRTQARKLPELTTISDSDSEEDDELDEEEEDEDDEEEEEEEEEDSCSFLSSTLGVENPASRASKLSWHTAPSCPTPASDSFSSVSNWLIFSIRSPMFLSVTG